MACAWWLSARQVIPGEAAAAAADAVIHPAPPRVSNEPCRSTQHRGCVRLKALSQRNTDSTESRVNILQYMSYTRCGITSGYAC